MTLIYIILHTSLTCAFAHQVSSVVAAAAVLTAMTSALTSAMASPVASDADTSRRGPPSALTS
jgi:hypothetical protein